MPTFQVNTNVSKDKIPKDFLKVTAEVVARTLGKPESYVVVQVNPDQLISFGMTNDPCAIVTLGSIGRLGLKENKKHSAVLFSHIEKTLGIAKDRMYIMFEDLDKANVGYMGQTFDDIL